MSYTIRIKANPEDQQCLFSKSFNSREDFQAVLNHCKNRKTIGFFEASVITVRTNNLNNFCKDFFLPSFFNYTLKIKDIGERVLITTIGSCLDICGFPIRVLTIAPRVIYNLQNSKQDHPLYKYLVSNGVPLRALEVDHIYLEQEYHDDRREEVFGHTLNFIQVHQNDGQIVKSHKYSTNEDIKANIDGLISLVSKSNEWDHIDPNLPENFLS